uniref:ARAD1D27412p n=1 Tax=Blastobotrys adeninivorans TaxID=409370 RepID=A0A060TH11_BLAAD
MCPFKMSPSEKSEAILPQYGQPVPVQATKKNNVLKGPVKFLSLLALAAVVCVVGIPNAPNLFGSSLLDSTHFDLKGSPSGSSSGSCVNAPKLVPADSDLELFKTPEFRNKSLERFSGAIRIPTESIESYGPPEEDPRWEVFNDLEAYLEEAFPLVHKHLKKEVVHKHGLLYTWEQDTDLKPIILMAHQDVVPVLPETVSQWKYPAYDAHFDGKVLWGRGTGDDKHMLIAILEAIETMLEKGLKPRRSVVLSFGYDEESSGKYGAGHLANFLEDRYGPDSFEAIVDEGGMGIFHVRGTDLATISVGEKGRFVGNITVYTPGGHGSIPPDHTGIGIAADLVTVIESTPHEAQLTLANPFTTQIHCVAEHSETMDEHTRRLLLATGHCPRASQKVVDWLSEYPLLRYNMQTSQAVNIFHAGLKVNALPEKVSIEIDQRVSVDTSVAGAEKKLLKNIMAIAEKYDLGLVSGGKTVRKGASEDKYIVYEREEALEPAPVSPIDSDAWKVLAGTVRHVYEDFGGDLLDLETMKYHEPKNVVVSPGLMTGNTDTRYYWNLSRNIFRFTPLRVEDDPQVHTVNEHISLDGHIEGVVVFYQYLQNI